MSAVKWSFRKINGGWEGVVDIPMLPGVVQGGGKLLTVARGQDKATALAKASAVADKVMENPIVQALMPPQAALAVKAIKVLSKGAAAGQLADVAKKFTGPAMKRLGKALGGIF
jgi:hypothetical protein